MKNIFRKLIDLGIPFLYPDEALLTLHTATNEKYNKAFTRIEQRVAPVEFLFLGIF